MTMALLSERCTCIELACLCSKVTNKANKSSVCVLRAGHVKEGVSNSVRGWPEHSSTLQRSSVTPFLLRLFKSQSVRTDRQTVRTVRQTDRQSGQTVRTDSQDRQTDRQDNWRGVFQTFTATQSANSGSTLPHSYNTAPPGSTLHHQAQHCTTRLNTAPPGSTLHHQAQHCSPAMSSTKQLNNRSGGNASKKKCPLAMGLEDIAPLVRTVEEIPEPITTVIKGNIPSWINGSFLRNGPGKFEFGKDNFNHWFDGMALMHRFYIHDGEVTYSSRFLRSDSYVRNSEKDRIVVCEFGTMAMPDPCKNFFSRFLSRFKIPKATDNASVNFVKYKGDYYVSTETNYMRRVDPQSLETKEKVDWSEYIAVNSATAHPHYDREGASYNMGNSYGKGGFFYNIIRVPPPEKVAGEDKADFSGAQVLCSIPASDSRKPSYYHSFGQYPSISSLHLPLYLSPSTTAVLNFNDWFSLS
ncbi:unnamed protein product [Oncorhynchus mykiss]|uniref:Beta-carotene 15, 15-dioxygenase 2, like n=1 Tax=Oncorhynchus mykiss TaxID=8022 RepID=A0A060Y5F0_ONCMY|nr:unnamed protein product [Oncorhynchus mykiss]